MHVQELLTSNALGLLPASRLWRRSPNSEHDRINEPYLVQTYMIIHRPSTCYYTMASSPDPIFLMQEETHSAAVAAAAGSNLGVAIFLVPVLPAAHRQMVEQELASP